MISYGNAIRNPTTSKTNFTARIQQGVGHLSRSSPVHQLLIMIHLLDLLFDHPQMSPKSFKSFQRLLISGPFRCISFPKIHLISRMP
ncbi:hypothetical protein HanXRQr2_Chr03g0101161 [Helianthus annuus]|uniref:Uncharacterized protein n=1 Tax=Helianthus annuus TaxID=4232 RepID=A0A9K3JDI8_HELAN|nr:hypothetical protein HanXRQr2_Chr03g0101161 [Helianthus annuus]KAJ0942881.1 hypothetical protein HanPSC8_Chr03g0097471 [Helianthus annuus]